MRPRMILGLIGSILVGLPAVVSAQTQDNFQLNTTSDLVALCSADAASPLMTAAANMCHGFMIGTYRVLATEEMKERHKSFCMTSQAPNRNEAVSQFVAWARANPPQMEKSPSDSVLAFLENKFPCKSTK
jgi:Rap1a immunity proteins